MNMTARSLTWLLAAYLTTVIAGPLPHFRHQFSTVHYVNTSSTLISTYASEFKSVSDSTSIRSDAFASHDVKADTAVVVEPIDRTVFTLTESAITFVDPKGNPLVTQSEEKFFSTSYLTEPSSTGIPTLNASPRPSSVTALATSTSTQQSESPIGSTGAATAVPSEPPSDNATTSDSTPQGPMFTYEPNDITTKADHSKPTVIITISSFTTVTAGLNGTASQTAQISATKNATMATTTFLQSTSISPIQSGNQSTATAELTSSSSAERTILVTRTDYTTLYASSRVSTQLTLRSSSPSPSPSSAAPSELPISSLTRPFSASSVITAITSSSIPAGLPTSSLSPPPIIVITPSPTGSSELVTSSTTEVPLQSNPLPSSSPTAGQSSREGDFPSPTHQPAASSDAPSTTSDAVEPSAAPTDPNTQPALTPAPTTPLSTLASPSSVQSASSSGPLVVVPIDTSQLFTVTETMTKTEKETVTVTATVTA